MGLFSRKNNDSGKMYSMDDLTVMEYYTVKGRLESAIEKGEGAKARPALENLKNFQLSKKEIEYVITLLKKLYATLSPEGVKLTPDEAKLREDTMNACLTGVQKLEAMIR